MAEKGCCRHRAGGAQGCGSTADGAYGVRGSLNGRRVWGRMDSCICWVGSLFCLPETITISLMGHTPKSLIKRKNYRASHADRAEADKLL